MNRRTPRVAIIDDDAVVFTVYKSYLAETFEVVTFEDPTEAVAEIKSNADFDVIVSDLIMPELSGLDVMQKLAEQEIATPVIIATGYADKENSIKALQNGAFSLIEKPINGSTLFFTCQKAAVFHQLKVHNKQLLDFYRDFFGKLDKLEHFLGHLAQLKPFIDDLIKEKYDLEKLQKVLKKTS